MRFKKSSSGYMKLGFIFMIFSSILSSLIMLGLIPALLGAGIFGGIPGLLIMIPAAFAIIIYANGRFVYWFFTDNRFER